jgi:hypothetical protein
MRLLLTPSSCRKELMINDLRQRLRFRYRMGLVGPRGMFLASASPGTAVTVTSTRVSMVHLIHLERGVSPPGLPA